jgi:hypothetical protein
MKVLFLIGFLCLPVALFGQADNDAYIEEVEDDLATGLHLLLHLDEGTGSTVEDISGNSLDGTLEAGAAFDGDTLVWNSEGGHVIIEDSEFLEVEDSTEIGTKPSFSISFWAALTLDLTADEGEDCATQTYCAGLFRKGTGIGMFIKYDSSAEEMTVSCVMYLPNPISGCDASRSASEWTTDLGEFEPMDLHHYVVVFDKNDTLKVYVDGNLESTATNTTCYPNTTEDWVFGTVDSTPYSSDDAGVLMDDITVWVDKILVAADIEELWMRGFEGEPFFRGDVDFDNDVDTADLTALNDYLTNGGTLTCEEALDVNDYGSITAADATLLAAYLFSPTLNPIPVPNKCDHPPSIGDAVDGITCLDNSNCDS